MGLTLPRKYGHCYRVVSCSKLHGIWVWPIGYDEVRYLALVGFSVFADQGYESRGSHNLFCLRAWGQERGTIYPAAVVDNKTIISRPHNDGIAQALGLRLH